MELGKSVKQEVLDSVWNLVYYSVFDSVRFSIRVSVRNSAWASVSVPLLDSTRDSVNKITNENR